MIGIEVDVSIKDEEKYLTLPVIPPSFSYCDGDATPVTIEIIDLGPVAFHNGVELDTLTWSCFFPARYDPSYCKTAELKTPEQYRNQFSYWKDTGQELQVIIPAAGINKSMKLVSFRWEFQGFEGDLYYEATFREHKKIIPVQIGAAQVFEPEPERDALPVTNTIAVGDVVRFKGGGVYVSSNAASVTVTRGEATCDCTQTYSGKHPYHLIVQKGGGDFVYGWVDAENCEKL